MNNERVKLIIKNIELLLEQLKLEFSETNQSSNTIHIKDLITKDDYEDPDYYEEPDDDIPINLKWRNTDDI